MNTKISKEQHIELNSLPYKEFIFGSHLHGVATDNSDFDYIRIINDSFYDKFTTLAKYLPNIHSFQFDDRENNTQIIWMTERQFYHNLFSGDGNMIADIVILSGKFNEVALFYTFTYKVIKGYLGVAKRDIKIHKDNEKKRFHAYRSLYMGETLMKKELPKVEDIKALRCGELPTKEWISNKENNLRSELNSMLNSGVITHYPKFKENDTLVQLMVYCNNIVEFKY